MICFFKVKGKKAQGIVLQPLIAESYPRSQFNNTNQLEFVYNKYFQLVLKSKLILILQTKITSNL